MNLPIPADPEAERAVLGAALHDAAAATVVAEGPPEIYQAEAHRDVARALQRLLARARTRDGPAFWARVAGRPAGDPAVTAGRRGLVKPQPAAQFAAFTPSPRGLSILFVSAERSRPQIGQRLLSRGRRGSAFGEGGFYISTPAAPT